MSCSMVLLDLKAILTLVCLNRLEILGMCGEVKVKVAHFRLSSVLVGSVARIILCCIWRFNLLRSVVGNLFFFCNMEDGLPFTVLLVVVEGEF